MPAQLVSFPVKSFRYRIGVPHNWWQARKMTNASSAGLIPSPELQVQDRGTAKLVAGQEDDQCQLSWSHSQSRASGTG